MFPMFILITHFHFLSWDTPFRKIASDFDVFISANLLFQNIVHPSFISVSLLRAAIFLNGVLNLWHPAGINSLLS